MQKTIGFDIDDTLYPFFKYLLPILNEKYSKNIKYNEIKSFDVLPYWNITIDDFKEDIKVNNLYGIGKIDSLIVNLIKQLEKEGIRIVFVTSRFKYDDYDTNSNTIEWLKKHGLGDIKVFFNGNKGNICKEHNIDLFIDDGLHNILDILDKSNNTKVLLMDNPWNGIDEFRKFNVESFFNKIDRIKNLEEIINYI